MNQLNDISLVAQVVVFRNTKAFDQLVKKYQSPVRRFFLNLTCGDSELSDKTRLSKRIQILLLSGICPVSPRGCIELRTIYFMIIFAVAKKRQTLTPKK